MVSLLQVQTQLEATPGSKLEGARGLDPEEVGESTVLQTSSSKIESGGEEIAWIGSL